MTQTCRHCDREGREVNSVWVHIGTSRPGHNFEPKPEAALVEDQCTAYNHAEMSSTQAGCPSCHNGADPIENMKSLLKTLFPVAWKADRGRQDPELMAAYVSV